MPRTPSGWRKPWWASPAPAGDRLAAAKKVSRVVPVATAPANCGAWPAIEGQHRARPIAATLAAARIAARAAGVTRLSDVSGLAPFAIPVFQATRPTARLLSVSQGKGLTPRAAMVSALLEAVEMDCAERLPCPPTLGALRDQDRATRALWTRDGRSALSIALDSALLRGWIEGANLSAGGNAWIPWDLLSLDLTSAPAHDVLLTSAGLATGNNDAEASVSAVAELIEHDLQAAMQDLSARERRARELHLDSVTDPVARRLITHIRKCGFALRAWNMGQEAGIAAFGCAVTDAEMTGTMLPPSAGSGCHPDRAIALVRAILEAVQSRITLIAGARDDLTPDDYHDGAGRTMELVLGGLSFGAGPLGWSEVPHQPARDPEQALETLLAVAARRSPQPILLYTYARPHPELAVVRAIGPGLADLKRKRRALPVPRAPVSIRGRSESARPILFVGPSLDRSLIPDTIEARPPAICGDLAALLAHPPVAVGLIDGCFETAPTVWHKEILDLIAHGVPVAGAASLGALRAAELHTLGMIGVGRIFEAYADGRMQRDDAVLLSHAPAELGWQPITVSLVDAEAALQRAALPEDERRQLQRIVRRMDFRMRTWRACLAEYRLRTGRCPTLGEAQLEALATAKRDDAHALVTMLTKGLPRPVPAPRPPMTELYRIMLERTIPPRPEAPLPASGIALPA